MEKWVAMCEIAYIRAIRWGAENASTGNVSTKRDSLHWWKMQVWKMQVYAC